ncbi:MAG TPA: hypothetical protein DCL26_10060 [Alteromonas australica]|nr:hypothetical protein [Alteromonas australica]|tara:strand:- start:106 stop:1074 length:969 start_codon:yes stop_codon:yes gene_type:complete
MSSTNSQQRPVQIGLNTSDMAGSLRMYTELGFHNAGGHFIWGQAMAIQGLPESARGMMWWMVGRQHRVQLEFFNLTNPRQRPQDENWRCCDLGWTRFGIVVSDYDAARATLEAWNIPITGEISDPNQQRRLAFRDPFIGCYVEIFEDGEFLPGGPVVTHHELDSAIVYATSSVSDLASARHYYEEVLGLEIADDILLHSEKHEALWELPGAKSKSFIVTGGGFLLEIVEYTTPVGKPRAADYTVADQGILNIAVASHEAEVTKQSIERVKNAGYQISEVVEFSGACGTYILHPEREVELCSMPTELEAMFGYNPSNPFFGQQ